jgi:archaemetzincin
VSKVTANEVIGVLPIGSVTGPAPKIIAAHISGYFNLDARVLAPLDLPTGALDRQRLQYDAGRLINSLEAHQWDGYRKLVAVLDVDIFVPIFTHVFGEARQGGKVAVVSLFRLGETRRSTHPSQAVILERSAKIALHELGHLFNLQHCDNTKCLMHFSGGLADLDHLSFNLCRYCRKFFKDALFFPTAESV